MSRPRPEPADEPDFVGRKAELTLLEREVARAVSGEGRILIVRGEAGIGKTWLVERTVAGYDAAGSPLLVRRARCSDSVGTPAYWPWRRLLRGSSRVLDTPDGGDSTDAQLADPFERLYAATVEIFEICETHGAVLVIDDLQWADVGSIQLLDVLAQSIDEHPIAVLVTLRDPLAPSVASQGIDGLLRHRSVMAIPLGGWSVGEVREYLEATRRETTERATVETWHRVTGGNPYFVEELARTPASLAESAEPPGNVQRLIARRVEACDGETRMLLRLAAVIGRDFPLALAQRLARRALPEADVGASAIDGATRAHLLEAAETPGLFRFVHGLVADTLLRATPVRQLATLHGRLGELLAEQPALRVGGVAEVARHLATAAATLPDFAPRAALFSRWAGWEAALQQQHHLAAHHYRAALEALASIEEASGDAALERAELLVSLGQSLAIASPQDAETALDEAEALAERHLEGDRRERAGSCGLRPTRACTACSRSTKATNRDARSLSGRPAGIQRRAREQRSPTRVNPGSQVQSLPERARWALLGTWTGTQASPSRRNCRSHVQPSPKESR